MLGPLYTETVGYRKKVRETRPPRTVYSVPLPWVV